MNKIVVSGIVKKFPTESGWHYVALSEEQSLDLREIVKSSWPALIKADLKCGQTIWNSSIMPIKDGPLFIALPAKVRKAESIIEGQEISVSCNIKI